MKVTIEHNGKLIWGAEDGQPVPALSKDDAPSVINALASALGDARGASGHVDPAPVLDTIPVEGADVRIAVDAALADMEAGPDEIVNALKNAGYAIVRRQ